MNIKLALYKLQQTSISISYIKLVNKKPDITKSKSKTGETHTQTHVHIYAHTHFLYSFINIKGVLIILSPSEMIMTRNLSEVKNNLTHTLKMSYIHTNTYHWPICRSDIFHMDNLQRQTQLYNLQR